MLPDEGGDEGAGALWGGPVHQLPQLRAAHAGQAAPAPDAAGQAAPAAATAAPEKIY